jgi:hypothetical protein
MIDVSQVPTRMAVINRTRGTSGFRSDFNRMLYYPLFRKVIRGSIYAYRCTTKQIDTMD